MARLFGLLLFCASAACDCGGECAVADETCVVRCDADRPCPAGAYCDASGDDAVCRPAGDVDEGGACASDADCQSGACDGVSGRCSVLCSADAPCGDGRLCAAESPRRLCVVPAGNAGVGLPCGSSRECATGVCAQVRADDESAVCALGCSEFACADGFTCVRAQDAGANFCARGSDLGADGESCRFDDDCRSRRCVLDVDDQRWCASVCVSGSCKEGFACADGADGERDGSVCLPPLEARGPGEACESARQCASARCVDFLNDDVGFVCAGTACESGRCENQEFTCRRTTDGTRMCQVD